MKSSLLLNKWWYRDRYLYLFLVPVVLYFLIFRYLPMLGTVMAFQNFKIARGIFDSPWVGFKHFISLFSSTDFWGVLSNTVTFNIYLIAFGFPVPIILAILLNEIRSRYFKNAVQSILYIPHFISWIVLGGIFIGLLSPSSGIVNSMLTALGFKPVFFMADPGWWTVWFVISAIWQGAGWGTIIYLAAISGLDTEMYEAATIDGAGRFTQILRITLPSLMPTIAVMLILRTASIMDVGFEHVYALQNDAVRISTDVISTYVYRMGVQGGLFSYTTAVGLFQSVVGMLVVLATNRAIKAMGQDGLW